MKQLVLLILALALSVTAVLADESDGNNQPTYLIYEGCFEAGTDVVVDAEKCVSDPEHYRVERKCFDSSTDQFVGMFICVGASAH